MLLGAYGVFGGCPVRPRAIGPDGPNPARKCRQDQGLTTQFFRDRRSPEGPVRTAEEGSRLKGITNAPLFVVVADQWYARPEILALMEQGHRVVKYSSRPADEPDLLLAPFGHAWTEEFFDGGYLPAALTAARARRRRGKGGSK